VLRGGATLPAFRELARIRRSVNQPLAVRMAELKAASSGKVVSI